MSAIPLVPLAYAPQRVALGDASSGDILVRRNDQGLMEPVDRLDEGVSEDGLARGYGLWHDQQVTKGHLFWKHVVRPLDGKIQSDEVNTFQNQLQPYWTSKCIDAGTECSGATYLNTLWQQHSQIVVEQSPHGPLVTLDNTYEKLKECSQYEGGGC